MSAPTRRTLASYNLAIRKLKALSTLSLQRGLFEDIAEGLRHAQVVVACVSDQYARSSNCVMEYRFASGILKIPTVLAIVGTGHAWRSSEVGVHYPELIACGFQAGKMDTYGGI